jgi:hypothetical protein
MIPSVVMSRAAAKPVISIVLAPETLTRIDGIADRMRRSRSSIIELLCLDAMDRQPGDGTFKVGIIHTEASEARA